MAYPKLTRYQPNPAARAIPTVLTASKLTSTRSAEVLTPL